MGRREKSRKFLSQARDEFLKADEFKDEFSYFLALAHYQLAAVNALKAYLYSMAELSIILYIESVYELIDEGKQFDPEIESISSVIKLNRLSRIVTPRAKNELSEDELPPPAVDDPLEVNDARKLCKAVLDYVVDRIELD